MNSTKGFVMGIRYVVLLLIAVTFVVLFTIFLDDFKEEVEGFGDYKICKTSNENNARLKLKIDNFVITERLGNSCATEYITVEKDQEFEVIAERLAQCWDMYLEGREQLFETKDNNYCAFCSVLDFEEEKQLDGLIRYLMHTPTPLKYSADRYPGKAPYFTYLSSINVTDEELRLYENQGLKEIDTLHTSDTLAIIFTQEVNANPDGIVEASSVSTSAGAAFGVLSGGLILTGLSLCATFIGCGVGLGMASFGTKGLAVSAGAASAGYFMGSTSDPNRKSRVLLWPYDKESLEKLKCTQLEGRDRLTVR